MENIATHRKIVLGCVTLIIVLFFSEVLAQITFHTLYDHWYQPHKLKRLSARTSVSFGDDVPGHMLNLAVHPYFGFAADIPTKNKGGFGFGEPEPPAQTRRIDDRFRVLLLGGSVAVQVANPRFGVVNNSLHEALGLALHQAGLAEDVFVFKGAIPGFKQPQQLNVYTFLLTQGAEFDLVINLDGFNEMTLAIVEGQPKGLHPVYPRGWDVMMGRRMSPSRLKGVGRLLEVRANQVDWLEFAVNNKLARSAFAGLFIANRILSLEDEAREFLKVVESSSGKLSFEEGGITTDFQNDQQRYEYLADLWMRSSVLMSQVAAANGARYLHVFQPNQYLEGSKQLTQTERDKAYAPDLGFGRAYRATYPYFKSRMKTLLDQGVWFVDGSMIFKNEERTVYIDVCCHFNELGVRTIAEFIAEQVVEASQHTAESR